LHSAIKACATLSHQFLLARRDFRADSLIHIPLMSERWKKACQTQIPKKRNKKCWTVSSSSKCPICVNSIAKVSRFLSK
jgi:hypothetical protein